MKQPKTIAERLAMPPLPMPKTAAQKKKAIVEMAKDVLLRLGEGTFAPGAGYFYTGKRSPSRASGDLREHLPKMATKQMPCIGCARGALFLAKVDLFNQCAIRPETYGGYDHESQLLSVMSVKQMRTIEAAYEGWGGDTVVRFPKSAKQWCTRIPDAKERMRAIMQNIIKNGGTFKVSQLPKAVPDGR